MREKTLDFDAFMAEKNREYVTVTVYGREYRVRREIPALMPILMARAGEETSPEEAGLAVLRCGDILFGREAVDAFCRAGMSCGELSELIQKTFCLITGEEREDPDEETLTDEAGKPAGAEKTGKK